MYAINNGEFWQRSRLQWRLRCKYLQLFILTAILQGRMKTELQVSGFGVYVCVCACIYYSMCSICMDATNKYFHASVNVRAAAHQLHQDKHQNMKQKTQSCFIRDSDWSSHTEVARVCLLSHLL
jgi:hypothetical protein